jgi:hypothetical protein
LPAGLSHHLELANGHATFPGKIPLVGADDAIATSGEERHPRIEIGKGRLLVILMGYGSSLSAIDEETVEDADARIQDLQHDNRSGDEQLKALREMLAEVPELTGPTDVLFIFSGAGSADSLNGIRLQVRSGIDDSVSWIRYSELLDLASWAALRFRVYLVIDAVGADGSSVVSWDSEPFDGNNRVPVLDVRRSTNRGVPATGLERLLKALRSHDYSFCEGKVGHWNALSMNDMAALSGGALRSPSNWLGESVGLFRNPLSCLGGHHKTYIRIGA